MGLLLAWGANKRIFAMGLQRGFPKTESEKANGNS
jgi:hypothetical protein